MAIERTLAIIKPDAVQANHVGEILSEIEHAGFKIVAAKMVHLTKHEAEGFYAVHRGKGFFDSLTNFMSDGRALVMVLERENAIQQWRDVMGATNPAQAAAGTLRKKFGSSIERNACHGSDAPETAAFEIGYFFNALEIFSGAL